MGLNFLSINFIQGPTLALAKSENSLFTAELPAIAISTWCGIIPCYDLLHKSALKDHIPQFLYTQDMVTMSLLNQSATNFFSLLLLLTTKTGLLNTSLLHTSLNYCIFSFMISKRTKRKVLNITQEIICDNFLCQSQWLFSFHVFMSKEIFKKPFQYRESFVF